MNLRYRIRRLERQSGVSRRSREAESDAEFLARVKAATPPGFPELSDADLERFIRWDADLEGIARQSPSSATHQDDMPQVEKPQIAQSTLRIGFA